jgi:hypothetical protein
MLEAVIGILGVAVFAIFGWAFSISNRVSVLEADKESLQKLIDAKFESFMDLMREKMENVTHRLARIEAKLDHEMQ